MRIKGLVDEDFTNYKKPSMFISTCKCDWKCLTEKGLDLSICQNSSISKQNTIEVSTTDLCSRYLKNSITKSIVIGGLEPMLQFDEVVEFIEVLRNEFYCSDDVVIYTGYYKEEILAEIEILKLYPNIIIKYGRYVPNDRAHFDEVLGVELASQNQFAERIS